MMTLEELDKVPVDGGVATAYGHIFRRGREDIWFSSMVGILGDDFIAEIRDALHPIEEEG